MHRRRPVEALVGLHVALVVGSASALAARALGLGRPGIVSIVAGGGIVAVAGTVAARRVDDLGARLSSAPVAVAAVLPPLGLLPYAVLATEGQSTGGDIALIGAVVGAVVTGVFVPVGGVVVETARLRATATEVVAVTVGDADGGDDARHLQVVGIALVSVGVVTTAAGVALASDPGGPAVGGVVSSLGGVSTMLTAFGDDETELAVTDRGLRVDRSLTRWTNIDGYRLTDDELVFVRSEWYRPDRRFDRDAIDDETTLLDALGDYLPRVDGHGRVEVPADRG